MPVSRGSQKPLWRRICAQSRQFNLDNEATSRHCVQEALMTNRTITVTIPEALYLQLEAASRSSAQSLDAVVAQSLERTILPHLASLLPARLRAELDVMVQLSDEALRAIALSLAPQERGTRLDDLIARKQDGSITLEQQAELTGLSAEAEALMVRKAHAFALLKSRGHALPPLDQLPVPAS